MIRNDSEALVASISRGQGWLALSALGVVLSLTGAAFSLVGMAMQPTLSTPVVVVTAILGSVLLAMMPVYAWLTVNQRRMWRSYQLVISAEGIAWSTWRGRAAAPWSAIRGLQPSHGGRVIRVQTDPPGLLTPRGLPLWHREFTIHYPVRLALLELDRRTFTDAVTRFSAQASMR